MRITTVFFDLDGTLLPMDQDAFIKRYFGGMTKKLAPYGFDPEQYVKTLWAGTKAMVQNDGSMTNEQRFWEVFTASYGEKAEIAKPLLEEFYEKDFPKVAFACGQDPYAPLTVHAMHQLGLKTVLATNPIFPAVATHQRLAWAGLNTDAFIKITTYENSRYCKPNLKYYEALLEELGLKAEECMMVGNDVSEDMIARKLGFGVFLITDNLLNPQNEDIDQYPHGNFRDFVKYMQNMQ